MTSGQRKSRSNFQEKFIFQIHGTHSPRNSATNSFHSTSLLSFYRFVNFVLFCFCILTACHVFINSVLARRLLSDKPHTTHNSLIRSDEGLAVKRQLSTTVANLPLIIISVDKSKCWCFTVPRRSTTASSESYLSTMVKYRQQ